MRHNIPRPSGKLELRATINPYFSWVELIINGIFIIEYYRHKHYCPE